MDIGALNIDKSNWVLTPLGDLATEVSERVDNPSESEYEKFVGLEHFVSGDLKIRQWGTTGNLTSSTKAFKSGDVLFARRNAYLKRASLVSFDGVCSGDAFVLRENHEMIVPGFLAFVVNSNALWDYANANAAGTMSKRVKWRDLANYEFRLPPKDQQAHLAELLWAIDMANDQFKTHEFCCERLYECKREFDFFVQDSDEALKKNSLLKRDVNKRISFRKLGDCLEDIKYGTSAKNNSKGRGKKIVGIPNVVNEKLSLDVCAYVELSEKEFRSTKLNPGDIVIVRTNGNPDYTGRSAIINVSDDLVYASYLIKISLKKELFNPEYLVRYLQTKTVRRFFRRHATSTAGNYNINTESIKKLPVPIVPFKQQEELVTLLREIEITYDLAKKKLIVSKELKKNLINQVF